MADAISYPDFRHDRVPRDGSATRTDLAPVGSTTGTDPARVGSTTGTDPARVGSTTDIAAAARAARSFLEALGVSCDSPGMRQSPLRMAQAYESLLTASSFDMTTFPNDEDFDGLVVVTSIPLHSLCEHHLLPFTGVAHVGYLPADRILGLSKLARVVEMLARRPQMQERLTRQVATWLDLHLAPKGVGVVIEAEHLCMTLRGVRARGAVTRTSVLSGALRDVASSRAEFMAAVGAHDG